MIVKLEQDLTVEEIEILIRYAEMTDEVERIAQIYNSVAVRIKCSFINPKNGERIEKLVSVSDIYYFESVDKMTFVYCEKEVYRTDLRLYQITDDFGKFGFVQISKSCVLNVNMLDGVAPLPSSRMEATLTNGEKVYVTRKYLENIKSALKEGI